MFQRRAHNRRKPSREQRAASRKETAWLWARRLGTSLAVIAVGLGLPYLVLQGYSHTMQSEYFQVNYLDVEGLNYLEERELLEAAERIAGENILNVDPRRIESAMSGLPFVRSVDVERRLPDRLRITIEEYEPAALIADEGIWLADTRGEVFLAMDSARSIEGLWDLPLVTGLTRADLVEDEARQRLLEALSVWELYHAMELDEQQPLSELHLDAALGLSLVTAETGTEIRLGWGRWQDRLSRLKVVQTSLIRRGMDAEYVLIDQERDLSRVTVGPRTEPWMREDAASTGSSP
ncbi:FtsQ-type POTRA domain-containing protein [Lujinxingia vulgaris]|uniref:FtsQ-type POTRA domain-containing protein n=1 Tax=Lujinxingia vulgaris TaxID=2600176 RepID=A0A5C6XF67_9DELT|nr:FtsQ-type POTRA domain-containing protein [Lujinxingia vulgaris]TXD37537.1 FtsQ-type POTRA domain-containing protein [Lujinxingia vulgaris]